MDTGDRTVYLAEVLDAGYGMNGAGEGDPRSGAVPGRETRAQLRTPLTFKRLLELAPAERLQEMKLGMNRDVELDRAAIVDWRTRRAATC